MVEMDIKTAAHISALVFDEFSEESNDAERKKKKKRRRR